MIAPKTVSNGLGPGGDESDLLEQLRMDVVKGDARRVRAALQRGAAPDAELRGGWTPLLYACSLGHQDVVQLLLAHGADPDCSKEHFTPLMAACASGREEGRLLACAELLAARGAALDARGAGRVTALMHAAREGHADLAALLLRRGADPRLRDDRGWTALFWAVHSERRAVAALLLQAEAGLYARKRSSPPPAPTWPQFGTNLEPKPGPRSAGPGSGPANGDAAPPAAGRSDIWLRSGLGTLSRLEARWRRDFASLGALRTALEQGAAQRPLSGRPAAARLLASSAADALRTAERLFQQARFLHQEAQEVAGTRSIIPADFIVQKKRGRGAVAVAAAWLPAWLTTGALLALALWQRAGAAPGPAVSA